MSIDDAGANVARDNIGKATDIFDSLANGSFNFEEEEAPAIDALESPDAEGIEPSEKIEESIEGAAEAEASEDLSSDEESALKKLMVKADGEEREFVLDPNNEELIEALQFGVAGKRAFTKSQKREAEYKKKLADYEKKYTPEVLDKAKSLEGIAALVEKGYTRQAVEALLGDKYEEFARNEIIGTVEYENATPEERAQMDRERARRERDYLEYQKNSKIEELERRLTEREEAVETERWHNLGEQLLHKYSMSDYVDDPVRAEKLNKYMWKTVWSEMAEADGEWSPRQLEMSFREVSSLLRGNLNKTVKDRVNKTIEAKKSQAKEQAQMISERNYSKDDAKDMRDKIMNEKSPMERLKMLMGR